MVQAWLAARRCISASEVAPPLQLQPSMISIIIVISSQQHQRMQASSFADKEVEHRRQSDQSRAKMCGCDSKRILSNCSELSSESICEAVENSYPI